MSKFVPPNGLLPLGSLLMLASAWVVDRAQRRYPMRAPSPASKREGPTVASVRGPMSERYAMLLLGVGMAAALGGILVEFQFYLAAATSGASGSENATFFASVYTYLNVAALVVQLLAAPALQRR